MYDVEKRAHKGVLDITQQNITTGHDRNKKMVYVEVTDFKVIYQLIRLLF